MRGANPARRAVGAAIAAIGMAAALLAAVGAPSTASASTGDLQVSLDGIHFSTALPNGLFDGVGLLVPGDHVVKTLWVRNASSIPGDLRISRSSTSSGRTELADAVTVRDLASTVVGQGAAVDAPACSLVAAPGLIEPGQTISIALTLAMSDLDARIAQNERLSLVLLAGLTEVTSVQPSESDCPTDATVIPVGSPGDAAAPTVEDPTAESASQDNSYLSGALAFTGSTMFYPSIMVGSVLMGTGLFFLLATRRRRRGAAE